MATGIKGIVDLGVQGLGAINPQAGLVTNGGPSIRAGIEIEKCGFMYADHCQWTASYASALFADGKITAHLFTVRGEAAWTIPGAEFLSLAWRTGITGYTGEDDSGSFDGVLWTPYGLGVGLEATDWLRFEMGASIGIGGHLTSSDDRFMVGWESDAGFTFIF